VADLKNSTQLGVSKYPASTASMYEAVTGDVVQVFGDFDADLAAIQGDGAFALFSGHNRKARSICAGITINTGQPVSGPKGTVGQMRSGEF
jgi:hypothetical protein